MTTLFISDIHLNPQDRPLTELFLRFLKETASQAEKLYILGDLFDAWIGDDDETPFHQSILHALKQVSEQGVKLYLMQGNRDFLLGKRFCEKTEATLLADPTLIDLEGTLTLLMHGDLLCTGDHDYQRYRRIVHWSWLQKCMLALPLRWRRGLANAMRQKSQQHQKRSNLAIMDVATKSVQTYMKKYQVAQLIHGHTHRPAVHDLMINEKPAKRYVLGAWHGAGNSLVSTDSGIEYKTFT